MAMSEEEGKLHSNHIKTLIFQLMMIMLYVNQQKFFKTSQLMNKSEKQRGRMTEKTEVGWG
jgi:hypothetical protein